MRIKLELEYDGAAFAGWQLQPNAPTVQGALEEALATILQHPARIRGAGRTDTGVHAQMQVATVDTEAKRTPSQIRDGLNALLPPSIACVSAEIVPDDFDPRHAPHTKTYRYTWLTRPARSPLRAGHVWHCRDPLDVDAMDQGARHTVGTHDFSAFRAEGCTATHPVRTVLSAEVRLGDDPRGDEVHLRIRGTGFLRHSVRILAGTLFEVGRGKRPPEWVGEVLAGRERARAGRTAPAEGLVLERIVYHGAGDDPR